MILRVVFPNTALRDHRIELVRASWQELTITISDISLSDEGQYTCSLFTMPVKTTKAFLTVLGEHVYFAPLSTDQLLVANSSCSHSLLFFLTTPVLLCKKRTFLHYIFVEDYSEVCMLAVLLCLIFCRQSTHENLNLFTSV